MHLPIAGHLDYFEILIIVGSIAMNEGQTIIIYLIIINEIIFC